MQSMPYTRRFRRRYTRSAYAGSKKKGGIRTLARRVKQLERERDYKTLDGFESSTALPNGNSPVIHFLSGIAQGDSHGDRSGDKVTLRSFMCKMVLSNKGVVSPVDSLVRIIIVKTRDTNGANPTLTGTTSTDILSNNDVNGFYNVHNSYHFKVLFDKVFTMDDTNHTTRVLHFYTKLNTDAMYSSSGSTVTSCQKNGIFLLAFSDQAAADNQPFIYYRKRIKFIDN